MNRILFVHNEPMRFVQVDRQLLSQYYQITELYETSPKRIRPLRILQAVKEHDLVFCWFASWHSFLPVLMARFMRKPAVVVIGGYDVANLPEAGYGSQRGGLPRLVSRAVIHNATHLITSSNSARREALAKLHLNSQKITMIYLGIESWGADAFNQKEKLVLTVGELWRANFFRKGLLPFVQAASHLPGVRFAHVGKWCDDSINELRRVAGSNVEFKGFVTNVSLNSLYQRASVYVQASLHESFGMSVAEAMLGGCIPVVTQVGSLPEVVGDTGVYAASNEPQAIAAAIQQALTWNGEARQQARQRVLDNFSLDQRRRALYNLLQSVLNKSADLDQPHEP